MSALADLQTAKDRAAAKLKEVMLNPKPDYSIDGQSVSWTAYYRMLTDQIRELNELIQIEGGPIEIRTQGVT